MYCKACYGAKVYCRMCKTTHCGCSWSECPEKKLEAAILASIKQIGGSVHRSAIAMTMPVVDEKRIGAALRRLAKDQKVYCVKKRYWTLWE